MRTRRNITVYCRVGCRCAAALLCVLEVSILGVLKENRGVSINSPIVNVWQHQTQHDRDWAAEDKLERCHLCGLLPCGVVHECDVRENFVPGRLPVVNSKHVEKGLVQTIREAVCLGVVCCRAPTDSEAKV